VAAAAQAASRGVLASPSGSRECAGHILRRPCERRDPYAVPYRFVHDGRDLPSQKRRWLWVPAFAGTTMEDSIFKHPNPSYSAKAEYPVRHSFSIPSLAPRNTGSPAGACHRAAIRPTRWQAMTVEDVARSYSSDTASSSRRDAPEVLMKSPPNKGRGERRVPAAPAASCALVAVESTRVTTSTPESPDVPARNGFTTYFVLSPVTGLFCHRHLRIKVLSKPGRADATPRT